jgi:hypothetical protein
VTELGRLLTAFRVSQALFVVAELGVAEQLADGPRSSDELADAVGADPAALYRVLRALAREGVFEEQDGRVFALTAVGRELPSLAAQARYLARPYHWEAWTEFPHTMRTGESAFVRRHGQTPWEYRAERPGEEAAFDAWMTEQTWRQNAAVVAGYDWSQFRHVVDVGGGHGALLRALLDANADLRGTLFDQPQVVSGAEAHERMDVVGGSFFESVPHGGDAYVLKSIVHDWPDEDALRILRTVAAALDDGARIVLLERDLAEDEAVSLDLQMLAMFGAGERTPDEYARLFEAAGLQPLGVSPVGAGLAAFEARR